MGILDLLFPKKCVGCRKFGEYLCPNCFAKLSFSVSPKCLICARPTFNGMTHPGCVGKYTIDGYFAALNYKGIVKKLLYQFKYAPYLTDLQTVLTDLFYEQLIQDEQFANILATKPILVPIPLSKAKLRKRGYNQSEILAKNLEKRLDLSVENLLIRTKETKPQYGLKREERIKNMRDAFGINPSVIARSRATKQSNKSSEIATPSARNDNFKTALLIDDILTTGSTLLEATKTLKRNGFIKVYGVVLAQD